MNLLSITLLCFDCAQELKGDSKHTSFPLEDMKANTNKYLAICYFYFISIHRKENLSGKYKYLAINFIF